jgi:hypothetical protein
LEEERMSGDRVGCVAGTRNIGRVASSWHAPRILQCAANKAASYLRRA